MFCPECGYKNPENVEECLNCGTPLKETPEEIQEEAGQETSEETPKEVPPEAPPEPDKSVLRLRTPLPQTPKEPEKGGEVYSMPPGENDASGPQEKSEEENLLNHRYKILDIIHQSGKSTIYKASDIKSGETVVVKEMNEDHKKESDSLTAVEQYRKALDTLEQLSHEGLPRILDNFSDGRKYYVVKTLAKGKSLSQIMKDRNESPLTQDEVIKWSLGILKVLDYLNSLEPPYCFRNLQPSNIVVDEWDNVSLVDFDLDRILSESEDAHLQGLPGFMAPEQFKEIVDGRSGIYSLGMIIRYLMTGIDPSDQKNRYRRYKRIKDINIKVDKWFDDIVLSMVEKSPDYRPGSAKEIISLFQSKMSTQPAGGKVTAAPVKPASVSPPKKADTYTAPPPVPSGGSQYILPLEEQKKSGGFRNYFIIFIMLAVIGIPTVFFLAIVFGPRLYSDQQITAAAKALEAKNYDKAIEILKTARDFDGKNPRIHLLMGKAYSGKKDYNNAIDSYMKAIRFDKNLEKEAGKDISGAYCEKGAEAAKKGDFNQAATDFKDAFEYDPELAKSDDPVLLFYRGLLAQHVDRKLEEAITFYTKSLKKQPNTDVFIARATAYAEAGNFALAKSDLDDAIKKDPGKKAVVEKNIKLALEKAKKAVLEKINSGNLDGAIADLDQIRKIFGVEDPEIAKLLASVYFTRGEQAVGRGDTGESMKMLNKSIELDPTNAKTYMIRSILHMRLKSWDAAISDLKKCQELDPKGMGRGVPSQIQNIERLKQGYGRVTTRYPTYTRTPVPVRTATPAVIKKGSEQYYILGGNSSTGYVAKKHKGGVCLLTGSGYLPMKKWYSAAPTGYHKITLYSDSYGTNREYEFKVKELQQFTVSFVSNTRRKITTKRTISSTKKVYTYTRYQKTGKVTLQTESGSAIFLQGTYATRSLERGQTYYGTQSASNVELFMGSNYMRRSFPISGSGGIY